ncbi:hypothetical protein T4B_6955 [Trichinella pseudospiralis]|uniref:Uncharacterized protein n=1 Tax=Trichinella pseudospiralis TaxID=6337 RepID=A0A0V1J4M8_TRIPS|nr:hypothetical protein T4B_6955 [Trichinella pseudospiralis]KRZ29605.1 hypothetical protein T4C_10073 [Trichinella pseudospiralis]
MCLACHHSQEHQHCHHSHRCCHRPMMLACSTSRSDDCNDNDDDKTNNITGNRLHCWTSDNDNNQQRIQTIRPRLAKNTQC